MKKVLSYVLAGLLFGSVAFGAALSANRSTPSADINRVEVGVYTNVHIYAGAIVAVNASGYAVPAADASGYNVIGRSAGEYDNEGGATDALEAKIDVGTFRWANAGDVSDVNLGDIAYVVDDQTVSAATNGTYGVIAGVIRMVDSEGVWVDTRQNKWVAISTSSTFAVSGNATVGGTLGVTGNTTLGGTLALTGVGTFAARPVLTLGASITTNGYLTVAKQNGSNALVYVSGTVTNILDATIAE